jgi:hypothetical protein
MRSSKMNRGPMRPRPFRPRHRNARCAGAHHSFVKADPPPTAPRIPPHEKRSRVPPLPSQREHAMTRKSLSAIVAAAALLAAERAAADTFAGLTADGQLVWIDGEKRAVIKSMKIEGAGARILGIDVRPANGKLYAVAGDDAIYTIDLASGKATMVAKLSKSFPQNVQAVVDFNPVADRLRLMGSDGTNYRVNVDTGEVAVDGRLNFDKSGAMKDAMPWIVAGAYTNSIMGAKQTALYDIDGKSGAIALQAPPNDGVLKVVGKLGMELGGPVAFDIWTDGKDKNWGILVVNKVFYAVDLATGATARQGEIAGLGDNLIDIAVLPAK